MGTTQDKIIKVLKDSESGLTAFEVAEEIDYPTKTKMSTHLRRLRNFNLVDYKIFGNQKVWFYIG